MTNIRVSCEPCRKRKSRCSRDEPCSNCVLRNIGHLCLYVGDGRHIIAGLDRSFADNGASSRSASSSTSSVGSNQRLSSIVSSAQGGGGNDSAVMRPTDSSVPGSTWVDVRSPHTHPLPWAQPRSQAQPPPLIADISWAQLSDVLPPPPLCRRLLVFFQTVEVLEGFVDMDQLEQEIEAMWSQGVSMPPVWVANYFLILSLAAAEVPSRHDLRDTYLDLAKSRQLWRDYALSLRASSRRRGTATIEEIRFEALHAISCAADEDLEECWEATGRALRKGAAVDLFRPACAPESQFSDPRCQLLAWKILHMDRWMALNQMRPLGVPPAAVRLTFPSPSTPMMLQLHTLDACHTYLHRFDLFSNQERYAEGEALLAVLSEQARQSLAAIGADPALSEGFEHGSGYSHLEPRRLLRIISIATGFLYMRCIVGMRFLRDTSASFTLRNASLVAAEAFLTVVPPLRQLVEDGREAVSLGKTTNQLFSAARVFTIATLGRDLNESGLGTTTTARPWAEAYSPRRLTNNLMEIISLLSLMQERGSMRAANMKVLLYDVCLSDGDLSNEALLETILAQPPDAQFLSTNFTEPYSLGEALQAGVDWQAS